MAATVRKPLIRQILWPKKEPTYGAEIADAEAGLQCITFKGERFTRKADIQKGDQVGRGHEYDDEIRVNNGWSADCSRSQDLDSFSAAWICAFGLGSVSTGATGSGYRHTFKPLDIATSPQLPSTCVAELQSDQARYRKHLGCIVTDFDMGGGRNTWLSGSYNVQGSGKVTDGTAIVVPTLSSASPFRFSDISVCATGASGATDRVLYLRSFRVKHANNLLSDDGYLCASTLVNSAPVRQRLEVGNRKGATSMEMILDLQRSSVALDTDYEAGTAWAVTLTCVGSLISGATYNEIKFVMPVCYIDDLVHDWDGDVGVGKLTLMPHYDSGTSAPFNIQVVNNIPTYLSAAA